MSEEKDWTLAYALAGALAFMLFVAYVFVERAGLWYYLVAAPFAYIGALLLLMDFVSKSRQRLQIIALIVLGAIALVLAAAVLSPENGFPEPYRSLATYCTTVKVPNATSPGGYTYGTDCSTSPTANPASFLWNLAYWLPISGLGLFALPTWRRERRASAKAGYAIEGLVLILALILPLVGVPTGPL